jgi:ETC complex I subunit conserved region
MDKRARLYKPAKTAMQSGRAKTQGWVLEFEPGAAKRSDALMGWAGSSDTAAQLQLRFATQEEALAYAAQHGIAVEIGVPQAVRVRPKAYADNFKYDRIR